MNIVPMLAKLRVRDLEDGHRRQRHHVKARKRNHSYPLHGNLPPSFIETALFCYGRRCRLIRSFWLEVIPSWSISRTTCVSNHLRIGYVLSPSKSTAPELAFERVRDQQVGVAQENSGAGQSIRGWHVTSRHTSLHRRNDHFRLIT
jgi:hypothetical protein